MLTKLIGFVAQLFCPLANVNLAVESVEHQEATLKQDRHLKGMNFLVYN
jgi:hypothetical protein